ncbi:MAG: NRDE family protein [Planctomycetota bacterium]|nr:NRDE family protein [Planctomycetota bacterium]
MCTLTFTGKALDPGVSDDALAGREAGYTLLFNRDELRARGPETAPAEARTDSGVRYIAPTDSDAGGTWIAANEHGVAVALLNGYVESRGPDRTAWTSRGALVRSLSDMRTAAELWRRMSPRRLRAFRPSVVVALGLGERPLVARWDGLDVSFDPRADLALPITSSSHDQSEVQRFRRYLYDREVRGGLAPRAAGRPSLAALEAYHRWTGPEGPTALSPCMARSDAATRSHCKVEVRRGEVRFHSVPSAPCEGSDSTTVILRSAR